MATCQTFFLYHGNKLLPNGVLPVHHFCTVEVRAFSKQPEYPQRVSKMQVARRFLIKQTVEQAHPSDSAANPKEEYLTHHRNSTSYPLHSLVVQRTTRVGGTRAILCREVRSWLTSKVMRWTSRRNSVLKTVSNVIAFVKKRQRTVRKWAANTPNRCICAYCAIARKFVLRAQILCSAVPSFTRACAGCARKFASAARNRAARWQGCKWQ